MSKVQEIESAISKLKPDEIRAVGAWLDELREELWDREIEGDAKAGRPDKWVARAKDDHRAGRSKRFP